ncbi:MAG: four helix bundle protein [Cytophagaceae bacterium]|jgi:four helix bundle protein|nr:four helix bundle protein [Cytophagaceae bacterium]
MKQNIIKEKSFTFALRIIKMYKFLTLEQKEFILSKQVIRSGTSIGANIEEACAGQSKKDFIAKMNISLKEAKETHYWLRLLFKSEYLKKDMFDSMISDCNEIILLLTRILQTSNENLEMQKFRNTKNNS